MRGHLLGALCVIAVHAGLDGPAAAEYPEQPIVVIVPTRAGGATDVGARTWAPYLERCLGNGATTAVVNMSGAGGIIGFTQVAGSPPDGYTLGVLLMPNLSTNIVSNTEAELDVSKFDYLGNFFGNAITLGVREDSDIKTIEDLFARAEQGPLNVGVAGIGNDDFLLVHGIRRRTNAQLVPIPLDGSASVVPALLGGHIDAAALSVTNLLTNAGKFRALAVATPGRVPEFPDLPTFREKGIDVLATSTHIVGAPAGLPADVKEKLSTCFATIAKDPAFQAEAAERKLRPYVMSGDEVAAHVKSETDNLRALWEADPWL